LATTGAQAPQWTTESILTLLHAHAAPLRRLGARRLGLFGSYRHGIATAASDIDLIVALDRPSFDSYMAVQIYLEDLFERRIDLVLESSLKPRLRDRILSETIYVEGL